MAIGVDETQDIIRRAVRTSRARVLTPGLLAPQEAGIATGPRDRRRGSPRLENVPDFLSPSARNYSEDWRNLDDDIYKFAQVRGRQLLQNYHPISHQFIFEVESDLKSKCSRYPIGSYLGIVRLAADLDQTRQNQMTGSEKNALHLLRRRLYGETSGIRDLGQTGNELGDLFLSSEPGTALGITDSLRMLGRSTKAPLLANMQSISSLHINVLVRVLQISARAGKSSRFPMGFRVGPMDVILGARSVLANRSLHHPTLEMLMELVLAESGLYHSDLMDWLRSAAVFGSETTIQLPGALSKASFQVRGNRLSALELAILGGKRTVKAKKGEINQFLSTLCDAMVYQVQRQDLHKDVQVKDILRHFNKLLHKERRSAVRLRNLRQQKRHDYLTAVEQAKQTAQSFQISSLEPLSSITHPISFQDQKSETRPVSGGFSNLDFSEPDADSIRNWNEWLGNLRRNLPRKSALFKKVMEVVASARSLDNCLNSGLTPAGARSISRFHRNLSEKGWRDKLQLPFKGWEKIIGTFSESDLKSQADFESLILFAWNFPQYPQRISFLPPSGARDFSHVVGKEEVDRLKVNSLLLARYRRDEHFTSNPSDPRFSMITFFCALEWACRRRAGGSPSSDYGRWLLYRIVLLDPDPQIIREIHNYLAKADNSWVEELVFRPRLKSLPVRPGWSGSFESDIMNKLMKAMNLSDSNWVQSLGDLVADLEEYYSTMSIGFSGQKNRCIQRGLAQRPRPRL